VTKEVKLPSLGEGIEGADVVQVLVEPGQTIAIDDPILEMESDKAAMEIPSPAAGVVERILVKPGDRAVIGSILLTLETNGAAAVEPAAPAKSAASAPVAPVAPAPAPSAPLAVPAKAAPLPSSRDGKLVPASPSVRRFAREIGIEIAQVPATGDGGRISIDDVKAHSRAVNAGGGAPAPAPSSKPLPDFAQFGSVRAESMSGIRRATATHMSHCWTTVPHVTQFDKADITEVEVQRKSFGKKVEAAGGKLTITAIAIKILAAALRKFPKFNSSVDMVNQSIVYKDYVHIGVAVDTDRGLLVPVIRDADQKNIVDIAIEIGELAERARDKKIGLADMQGGSMTVTNLGGIGGTAFTPIVNWPEVAILGIARGEKEPVWQNGKFVPRLMMPLSLSYDHRVIDGADGARFLRWIAEALENPFLIALEG
jgi:pyruvate dehydrogenase E2 component (dihydrolipoamide acetyltransferase)